MLLNVQLIFSSFVQSYEDARKVAENFSRFGRLLKNGASTKSFDDTAKSRLTAYLLDANTSLKYEMDSINRLVGLDRHRHNYRGKT